MKLNKWMFGAIALGLMASCSDKDIPGGNNQLQDDDPIGGYVALKINLPQSASTRAEGDTDPSGAQDKVDFQDGEDWEYNVESATLVFFTTDNASDDEDLALFSSTRDLRRGFAPTGEADNNISASSVEAVQVSLANGKKDKYLWVLVMLNKPEGVPVPVEGETFGDYRKKIADKAQSFVNTGADGNSIFMTNAPMSLGVAGGYFKPVNPKIQTLVQLGKIEDKVKSTIAEARENVAGCVYVEHAVAKVSAFIDKDVKMELPLHLKEGEETPEISVDIVNSRFGIINMNRKSYIVRNAKDFPETTLEAPFAWDMANSSANNYYRMIGSTPMPGLYDPLHLEMQLFYRTYWCVDPNYADAMWTDAKDRFDMDPDDFKNVSYYKEGKEVKGGVFYVKENTFTVQNQNYGNTTHAVFKVVITVDGEAQDLYILNDNHSEIYIDAGDVTSKSVNYILNQNVVQEALKKAMKSDAAYPEGLELAPFLNVSFEPNNGIFAAVNITLNKDATNFATYYDPETCDAAFLTALGGQEAVKSLCERTNLLFVISFYDKGVNYYMVPILHFGDSSTPWDASGDDQMTPSQAYGGDTYRYDSPNYLGRYGLVRNNWYEIHATAFKGLGSPVIPSYWAETEKGSSDDNHEEKRYIGVETHILSWAKRVQEAGF